MPPELFFRMRHRTNGLCRTYQSATGRIGVLLFTTQSAAEAFIQGSEPAPDEWMPDPLDSGATAAWLADVLNAGDALDVIVNPHLATFRETVTVIPIAQWILKDSGMRL